MGMGGGKELPIELGLPYSQSALDASSDIARWTERITWETATWFFTLKQQGYIPPEFMTAIYQDKALYSVLETKLLEFQRWQNSLE